MCTYAIIWPMAAIIIFMICSVHSWQWFPLIFFPFPDYTGDTGLIFPTLGEQKWLGSTRNPFFDYIIVDSKWHEWKVKETHARAFKTNWKQICTLFMEQVGNLKQLHEIRSPFFRVKCKGYLQLWCYVKEEEKPLAAHS